VKGLPSQSIKTPLRGNNIKLRKNMIRKEHTMPFIFGNHAENMKDDLCDAIQNHIENLVTSSKAAPSLNQKLQYQGMMRELRRFKKALLSVHYEIEDALNELP
jgi:hypothetical protein